MLLRLGTNPFVCEVKHKSAGSDDEFALRGLWMAYTSVQIRFS